MGYSFQTNSSGGRDFEYVVNGELPDINLWWLDDQDNLIDLSTGWTFSATITKGSLTYVTKSSGITGAAGSGNQYDGVPNLVIKWETNEFATIVNPGLYVLSVIANNTSSNTDMMQVFDFIYTSPANTTWTYTGNPADSSRDAVRFLVGDVDPHDQLASDQEVDWLLSSDGVYEAASKLCLAIAARFARCIDKSIGSLSRSYSQKYQHYLDLASTLSKEASSSVVAGPWGSGWSRSSKESIEHNTDREPTFASKGDMDYDSGATSPRHGWSED